MGKEGLGKGVRELSEASELIGERKRGREKVRERRFKYCGAQSG